MCHNIWILGILVRTDTFRIDYEWHNITQNETHSVKSFESNVTNVEILEINGEFKTGISNFQKAQNSGKYQGCPGPENFRIRLRSWSLIFCLDPGPGIRTTLLLSRILSFLEIGNTSFELAIDF